MYQSGVGERYWGWRDIWESTVYTLQSSKDCVKTEELKTGSLGEQ